MNPPSLAQLRDIHLPPPPPLASMLADPRVWGIGVGVLLLVVMACWWLRRYWYRRRLRTALGQVSRLARSHARDGDTRRLTAGLSQLLRQYAGACFPDRGMAGLSGTAWLEMLDAAPGGQGDFCHGVGSALEWRPYRAQGSVDEAALIALVRRWLKANPR